MFVIEIVDEYGGSMCLVYLCHQCVLGNIGGLGEFGELSMCSLVYHEITDALSVTTYKSLLTVFVFMSFLHVLCHFNINSAS